VHDGDPREDVRLHIDHMRRSQSRDTHTDQGIDYTHLCPLDTEEISEALEVPSGGQPDGVDVVAQPRHAQHVQLVIEECCNDTDRSKMPQ
jgi:hypothetical protein